MRTVALCLIVSTGPAACVIQRETTIHEPDNRGFENNDVTVIGSDPAHGNPKKVWFDGHCVWLEDGDCLLVDARGTWCELEGTPMDVVLAFDQVAALLCYREKEPIFYVGPGLGDLMVPHTGVGGTVYFIEATAGIALTGNVFVRGDEIMAWGNGPQSTIVDGDVVVSGDGVQIRNLSITGNLAVMGSAATLAYVTIAGNVSLSGHRSVLAKNIIFGSLEVTGSDNLLVENEVQAGLVFDDSTNTCDGNSRFADLDADGSVDTSELLGGYQCP